MINANKFKSSPQKTDISNPSLFEETEGGCAALLKQLSKEKMTCKLDAAIILKTVGKKHIPVYKDGTKSGQLQTMAGKIYLNRF